MWPVWKAEVFHMGVFGVEIRVRLARAIVAALLGSQIDQ